MADLTKLISLGNLQAYDTLIKKYVDDADAVVDAKSVKTIKVNGDNIEFYKKAAPADADTPDFTVKISSSDVEQLLEDVAELQGTVAGYTSTSTVASAIAAAQKAAEDHADAKVKELSDGQVTANANAILAINNTETGILAQATAKVTALENGQVKTNKEAIEDILDVTTGIEAVAKKYTDDEIGKVNKTIGTVAEDKTVVGLISDAQTTANQGVADAATAQTAADAAQKSADDLAELVGTIPVGSEAQTIVEYAKEVADSAAGDASQVAADLAAEVLRAQAAEKANADAITVINGADTVEGSTDKKIKDAINTFATQITDNNTVDTFKEVLDYLSQHDGDYATLLGVVQGHTGELETINGEGAGSIAKALADAKEYADGLDTAMDSRVDDLEATIGDAEGGLVKDVADLKTAASTGVDDKIKAAIEGLDAEKSQVAGADGLALSITEVDGKITAISGSIAAETYDAFGSAKLVQEDLNSYKYEVASTGEINAMFSKGEEQA